MTEDEKIWVLKRTGREKTVDERIVAKDILRFFSDPKNILGGIIYFGKRFTTSQDLPIYANHPRYSYGRSNLQYEKEHPTFYPLLIHSIHRFLLFCFDNHQDAWLHDCANAVAHSTPRSRRPGLGFDNRLAFRPHSRQTNGQGLRAKMSK